MNSSDGWFTNVGNFWRHFRITRRWATSRAVGVIKSVTTRETKTEGTYSTGVNCV
jgi:hypothetical protein